MAAPPPEIDKALERKLAARAADGDTAAVADLYDAYEQRLYGYCHRICRHPEDAADATQEAFCNVIQRLPGLDISSLNFGAYLFTAARNACMDIIGQRGRAEVTDEVPEDPFATPDVTSDPERAILTKDQQRAAREASDRLPETQRSVLALREVAGLSYDEIAESMEMNSNAVAQLISRARLNFHKQLRSGSVVIAPADASAERAIELTVKRQDGKIKTDDLAWLNAHLAENEASRVNAEAIQESAVLYRAIGPVAVLASLREATMARASTIVSENATSGSQSSSQSHSMTGTGTGGAVSSTTPPAAGAEDTTVDQHARAKRNSRRVGGVAALVLLFTLILAGVTTDKATTPISPSSQTFMKAAPEEQKENAEKAKKTEESTEPRSSQAPQQPVYTNNESAAGDGNDRKKSEPKEPAEEAPAAEPQVEQPPATPPPEDPKDPDPPPPKQPPGGPGSICIPPYCTTPPPG